MTTRSSATRTLRRVASWVLLPAALLIQACAPSPPMAVADAASLARSVVPDVEAVLVKEFAAAPFTTKDQESLAKDGSACKYWSAARYTTSNIFTAGNGKAQLTDALRQTLTKHGFDANNITMDGKGGWIIATTKHPSGMSLLISMRDGTEIRASVDVDSKTCSNDELPK